MGGLNNIYQYASNPLSWIDPSGLAAEGQLGTYKELTGRAKVGDKLDAHELVRNKALEQMGCGARTKSGKKKRHPDNPSITLNEGMHDRAHAIENGLASQHLGNGVNEFSFGSDGKPTKRQMDVWQGSLRKSGMSASQAKRLRENANKFVSGLCCC